MAAIFNLVGGRCGFPFVGCVSLQQQHQQLVSSSMTDVAGHIFLYLQVERYVMTS